MQWNIQLGLFFNLTLEKNTREAYICSTWINIWGNFYLKNKNKLNIERNDCISECHKIIICYCNADINVKIKFSCKIKCTFSNLVINISC